jgi:hypothetical protein
VTLLNEPKNGIEHQQGGNDRRLDVLAEQELKHYRRLEHARYRRPELGQCTLQRPNRGIGHGVGTDRLQPPT